MKILMQMAIIFFICLLGELISALLPIPFPASVIGMILVFLLLVSGPLKVYHISKQTDFLLSNMVLFFIPPAVGIIENIHYLDGKLLIFLFICIFSTVVTFGITAWTVTAVMKWEELRKERRHANTSTELQ